MTAEDFELPTHSFGTPSPVTPAPAHVGLSHHEKRRIRTETRIASRNRFTSPVDIPSPIDDLVLLEDMVLLSVERCMDVV